MSDKTNWWSFYAVRYTMASVIGAILVYIIFQATPFTASILFIPSPADLQISHLALWFSLGLAYCYLASLPVLVFHATRFTFPQTTSDTVVCFVVFVTALMVGITAHSYFDIKNFQQKYLLSVGSAVLFLLTFLQWYAIFRLNQQKKQTSLISMKELAFQRSLNRAEVTEYVESYRHLREHGNSFYIVLMEIFFATALIATVYLANHVSGKLRFSAEDQQLCVATFVFLMISVWVLPGVAIWRWGQDLEAELWKKK